MAKSLFMGLTLELDLGIQLTHFLKIPVGLLGGTLIFDKTTAGAEEFQLRERTLQEMSELCSPKTHFFLCLNAGGPLSASQQLSLWGWELPSFERSWQFVPGI